MISHAYLKSHTAIQSRGCIRVIIRVIVAQAEVWLQKGDITLAAAVFLH